MRRFLRSAVTLLMITVALSQPMHAETSSVQGRLHDLLDEFRQAYGFPGATVAVAFEDGSVETVAVGWADVEAEVAMTPDSRMLAASIGKTIWGALVLSLETEGVLSRADLVSDHIGDLRWFARVPNAETMTIGQLLTHTAGLPDHVHMEGVAAELINGESQEAFDPAEAVGYILDEPPLFEAASGWVYSDTGYLLLGMVIEAATGEDVFDLAQDRFLSPLRLTHTGPSDRPVIEALAVGYTLEDNPFDLPVRTMDDHGALNWNPAVEWTGGGFASTSANLAAWGHALFTGVAIDLDDLDRLLDGVPVHPDAPGVQYGSGIAIYRDTPFGTVYGHGGWIPGYVSSLRHYKDQGLTIAFQINSDVGVVDDSTDLVSALEAALAAVLIGEPTN